MIIFNAATSKQAASSEYRLPANYIGVRQVRPGYKRSKGQTTRDDSSKVVIKFTVVDEETGQERRMTSAEKRAKKLQLALEKKLAKQQAKEQAATSEDATTTTETVDDDGTNNVNASITATTNNDTMYYHQMPLNATAMEQELEELREENAKLAPVILSPPMAMQFQDKTRASSSGKEERDKAQSSEMSSSSASIQYSHSMSQEWANALMERRIQPAQDYRAKEDLRPLAYKIHPEPQEADKGADADTNVVVPKPCDWAPMYCRPSCPTTTTPSSSLSHDEMISIVFEYIHRSTPYYVSCGAKFGSDFLIYDGPREERHAFAGLRVLSPQFSPSAMEQQHHHLPLPTAFSLTSYVRCLNTAGKLALIATVVPAAADDDSTYQVLLIDVALEKVLDAPTHKRKRGNSKMIQEKRKDITKNLAKM
ncbi:MAG: hypothetical protein SGARI_002121 [Bacillariaceae sp.]